MPKQHPIMPHVTYFIERVKETMGENGPKNGSKAAVQAFLSGMPETISSLGRAAQKQCWPFGDVAFSEIRRFLEELSNL
jgi:hypothetical protein